MQNAQRLMRPMGIANPFARDLTFTSGRTRTRRDHEKYLTLIDTIALLHQHQREADHPRTSTTAKSTCCPSPWKTSRPPTASPPKSSAAASTNSRRKPAACWRAIKTLVRDKMKAEASRAEPCLFSRRELREATGWSEIANPPPPRTPRGDLNTSPPRGGRNGASCNYELLDRRERSRRQLPRRPDRPRQTPPQETAKSGAYDANLSGF